MTSPMSDIDRFFSFVQKTESCWIWRGGRSRDGYGLFRGPTKKTVRAHRFIYEHTHGSIPAGLQVMHSCDVRWCVNPEHLAVGTNDDNVADKVKKGRQSTVRLFGEAHGGAKLTEQLVREIRRANGTIKQIAERFGISPANACRIRRRELWPHVSDEGAA